ncbi:MAG: phage scaffolding protein [Enterococcaceae bacterium]|nr:phage scaffolding protein [Enterococcaceae bacterium]
MKREQLKELGLSDEQIGSIMALHGATVNELNNQLANAQQETTQYKDQLTANQTELDSLKEQAKGNEDLTGKLTELQNKFDETTAASQVKLAEQQKDFAIKLALKDANPLDEEIVLAQLDKDTIKVTDKGLQGFEEQLNALQENKSFLFQQSDTGTAPRTPTIMAGGNPQNGATEKSIVQKIQERLGE